MIRSLDPKKRRNWPELLTHLVLVYNCTPHRVTGMSPFRLVFGREPYTHLDQLLKNSKQDWDEEFVQKRADANKEARRVVRERMESMHNKENG